MYPRTNYEMTEINLSDLLEACKPTPVMMIGSHTPSSPQENANRAWQSLGKKMGFDHMTVQPINGKGQRFFSAVPNETETQRDERLLREKEEKQKAEVSRLEAEIKERQDKLTQILSDG